jgi:hypothetical protein
MINGTHSPRLPDGALTANDNLEHFLERVENEPPSIASHYGQPHQCHDEHRQEKKKQTSHSAGTR